MGFQFTTLLLCPGIISHSTPFTSYFLALGVQVILSREATSSQGATKLCLIGLLHSVKLYRSTSYPNRKPFFPRVLRYPSRPISCAHSIRRGLSSYSPLFVVFNGFSVHTLHSPSLGIFTTQNTRKLSLIPCVPTAPSSNSCGMAPFSAFIR